MFDVKELSLKAIEGFDFSCYIIDAKTYEIIFANSKATNYGIKKGGTCHELTHNSEFPCRSDVHPCPLVAVLDTKGIFRTKHFHEKENGEKGVFEVTGYPIFNERGDVTHVVECSFEITEQEIVKENLRKAQSEFFNMEKMATLGKLTSTISHEINNPLSMLQGYLHLMKSGKISCAEGLKQQEEVINQTIQLLRGIKSFTRESAPNDEKYFMDKLIIENLNVVIPFFEKESINVLCEIDYPDCLIKGKPSDFFQILMNLFSNAKDSFTDEQKEKKILLKLEAKNEKIVFSFSDNGKGIEENIVRKIFQPYFTTKEVGKGVGIGLAVVEKLTKKMNGTVDVQSEVGKGTTFIFTFNQN